MMEDLKKLRDVFNGLLLVRDDLRIENHEHHDYWCNDETPNHYEVLFHQEKDIVKNFVWVRHLSSVEVNHLDYLDLHLDLSVFQTEDKEGSNRNWDFQGFIYLQHLISFKEDDKGEVGLQVACTVAVPVGANDDGDLVPITFISFTIKKEHLENYWDFKHEPTNVGCDINQVDVNLEALLFNLVNVTVRQLQRVVF